MKERRLEERGRAARNWRLIRETGTTRCRSKVPEPRDFDISRDLAPWQRDFYAVGRVNNRAGSAFDCAPHLRSVGRPRAKTNTIDSAVAGLSSGCRRDGERSQLFRNSKDMRVRAALRHAAVVNRHSFVEMPRPSSYSVTASFAALRAALRSTHS